jgi:hypothetical protein
MLITQVDMQLSLKAKHTQERAQQTQQHLGIHQSLPQQQQQQHTAITDSASFGVFIRHTLKPASSSSNSSSNSSSSTKDASAAQAKQHAAEQQRRAVLVLQRWTRTRQAVRAKQRSVNNAVEVMFTSTLWSF